MNKIAKIVSDLRKEKGWSQTDLANESGISREIIGKYERGKATSSIDFVNRMADALGVSLDFSVGVGTTAKFDKKTLKRIQDIEQLKEDNKTHLYSVLDAFLRDATTRKAYAI
jgi:transcriptional regulator with XRE-family HTH domain